MQGRQITEQSRDDLFGVDRLEEDVESALLAHDAQTAVPSAPVEVLGVLLDLVRLHGDDEVPGGPEPEGLFVVAQQLAIAREASLGQPGPDLFAVPLAFGEGGPDGRDLERQHEPAEPEILEYDVELGHRHRK